MFCVFYCSEHLNNTLTAVFSISVTMKSKGNDTMIIQDMTLMKVSYINPVFTFFHHVSASCDVNSETCVSTFSPTF